MPDGPVPAEALQQKPLNIFVVDDNSMIFQTYEMVLGSPTRRLNAATSPQDASAHISQWSQNPTQKPDLVILDWNIGGPDTGWKVLQQIRQTEQQTGIRVPVMIVTTEPDRVHSQFGAKIDRLTEQAYGRKIPTPVIPKEEVEQIQGLVDQVESIVKARR